MTVSERQRGLGRGLSALLGEQVAEAAPVAGDEVAPAGVRYVPVESLVRNPDQPRKVFSNEEMIDLSRSIQEKGVLQPILVRPAPGAEAQFQIIAGERRWRAAQAARLTEVPIIVREMDDGEVLEVGIIENVQRADLNPVEEANAYSVLMERFGRTQDAVAGVVGKSRSHVANTLRLLQLPIQVLDHVMEGRLSAGHARALITARDPEGLAEQVIAKGLNVRQTEILARQSNGAAKVNKPKRATFESSADVQALEQDLADALGIKVELRDKDGWGELTLRYGSLEQLDELCRRLMKMG